MLLLAGLALGGCAQQPQRLAAAGHPKEYFPSSVYGPASRRVIADGEPVPHGGGQYLVGKPYTIAGQTYYPSERRVTQTGLASWYGDAFHGRLTANGEIYDRDSFTAAHPTMPLPSYARVTNLRNNSSMVVRVNDRGPYHSNRIMDVSRRVADALDIRRYGTQKVKVEWLARASLAGSDDTKLLATLRTGGPASLDGVEEGIRVATAPVRSVVASLGSLVPTARPQRIVEHERPDALERYRVPHVVASRPDRRPEPEPRSRSIRAGRIETAARPARPGLVARGDVDLSRTASLPRRESVRAASAARSDAGRQETRIAKQEVGERGRPGAASRTFAALEHAGAPTPPSHRSIAQGARSLPSERPVRLALAVPPHHPHDAGPRARSRGDR